MRYATGETRKDLELQIMDRAFSDPAFKALLIANPRAAIEQELGLRLPQSAKIHVLEETEDSIYFVLPPQAPPGAKELSDQELEAVAGGKGSEDCDGFCLKTSNAVAGVRG